MRALLAVLLLCAACGASAQWVNALAPKGERGAAITLASRGRTAYHILLAAAPTTQDRKAAEDLQRWLAEITGVTIPIAAEGGPVRGRAVSIGRTALLEQAVGPREDLGDEGYGIAERGGNLFLWGGRTRGVINAVYALLEEDLGCRWYTKDSYRIPRRRTLRFAPIQRTYAPRLRLRDPFTFISFDAVWSLRNRTNAPGAPVPEEWGGRIDYGSLFVHTFHQLLPPDRHFAERPELFMLDADGKRSALQLCTTNPDTVRLVTEAVLTALREHPHSELASVSKTDVVRVCHCPRCAALREAEGSDMACQLYLVNQVAEAAEREFPRVVIDTLAYIETVGVPRTVRPRHNVAIRLCNDVVGSWTHPFTPASRTRMAELTRAWSAVCRRIYIWDYMVNFSHYLAPMPNLDVIAENIRFWVAHNAEGIMTQGPYQSPGAERDELRSWVIAKLLWDPSLDLDALIRDFIWGHYGRAAPVIAEYEALLRQARADHARELEAPPGGIRFAMDHPFLSREFLDRATALFDRAERRAESETVRRRVERASLPILYVRIARGPAFAGEAYPALVDRFERIARQVGITHTWETAPNLDSQLAAWRKAWADARGGQ